MLPRIFLKGRNGGKCYSDSLGECIAAIIVDNVECLSSLVDGSQELLEHILSLGVRGVLLQAETLDTVKAAKRLESKLLTYRVILEKHPENKTVEAKLRVLSRLYERITEGHAPLKARYVFFVRSGRCEDVSEKATAIAGLLKVHGCNSKLVCGDDIVKVLLGKPVEYVDSKTAIEPMQYLSWRFRNDSEFSLYIGREVATGLPAYISLWNPKFGSSHVLVLGPTGKGKTTLLASIVARTLALDLAALTIIDPKGDLINALESLVDSVIVVDEAMLVDILCGVKSSRIPLCNIVGAGIELSEAECRLVDTNTLCRESENSSNIYLASARVKLHFAGISIEKLCECESRQIVMGEKVLAYDLSKLNDIAKNIGLAAILALHYNYYLKLGVSSEFRRVVIVDEAWRFSQRAKTLVDVIVKEFRSLGISLILSTQDPGDISESVWNNIGIAIVFGSHDKEYVKRAQRLLKLAENEAEKLRWLGVGEAMIKLQHSPRPTRVYIEAEPETVNRRITEASMLG